MLTVEQERELFSRVDESLFLTLLVNGATVEQMHRLIIPVNEPGMPKPPENVIRYV